MNILQIVRERIEKIGTDGNLGIWRLFVGTPYEIKIIRLSPEEQFTLHLPFVRYPINEESSRDVLQWVIDVKRKAMRDGNYIELLVD